MKYFSLKVGIFILPRPPKISHLFSSLLLDQFKCFENHRSILKIKETFDQFPKFNFENVTSKEVREIIYNLEEDKSTGADNIPPKVLKMAIDVVSGPLAEIFNRSISD